MDSSRKRRRFDDDGYDERSSRRRRSRSRSRSPSPHRKDGKRDYDHGRSRDRDDDRNRSSYDGLGSEQSHNGSRRWDDKRGRRDSPPPPTNGGHYGDKDNKASNAAGEQRASNEEADLKKQRLQKLEAWRKQQAAKGQAPGNASPSVREGSPSTPSAREASPGLSTFRLDRPSAPNGPSTTAAPPPARPMGASVPKPGPPPPRLGNVSSKAPLLGRSKLGFGDDDDDDDDDNGQILRRSRKLKSIEEIIADQNQTQAEKPAADRPETQQDESDDVDRMDVDTTGATEEDPLDAFMQDVSAEVSKLVHDVGKNVPNQMLEEEEAAVGEAVLKVDEDDDEAEGGEDEEDILALAAKAKQAKKKDLVVIDHTTQQYEPFRKDFWVEPPELAQMATEEVDIARAELDGIKIRGVDCPKPAKKWTQLGLPPGGLEVIRKVLKYDKPSPIQSQAIPAIMSGRDVIGVAKTGSGKTIAFLLPLFRHIKDQRPLAPGDGPIALIMTPTRELAMQIHRDCRHFARIMGLRSVCAYGGSPIKDQIADMKRGAEIVVCTPGRMIDLLCANSGRVTNLKRVTYLVLDEADRMFDMGFEPQVMKIVNNIRPDRQTVLFSATFPRQMEALARKILSKPLEITVGGRSTVAPEITQIVEVLPEDAKFLRLLKILGNWENEGNEDARALIFVEKQEKSDKLLGDLMHHGYSPLSIHGGKDQMDRDSTISDFKAGITKILIATSVAARGLDVKSLNLVINFDTPNHMEDYVHRVGRTGRAGNKGTAYTFISPEQDKYAVDIVKALKMSGTHVPEDLQGLADSFIAKVKAGNAKFHSSGYGGKGLDKLDEQRDLQKRVEKRLHGAEAGDEEEEDAEAIKEKEKEKIAEAAKPAPEGVSAAEGAGTGAQDTATVPVPAGAIAAATAAAAKSATSEALRAAQEKAAALNAVLGLNKDKDKDAQKDILKTLNIRYKGDGAGGVANLPSASAFSLEIDINDYPQKARWKVTNKEQMSQIIEMTGAAITTRGTFFPKGKEPDLAKGERKLFLFIEGDTELIVDHARTEIMRIIKDATIAAAEAEVQGAGSGRYSVV